MRLENTWFTFSNSNTPTRTKEHPVTTTTAHTGTATAVQRQLNARLQGTPGFDVAICYVDEDRSGYRVKVSFNDDAGMQAYTDWFGTHMRTADIVPIVVRQARSRVDPGR